MNIKKYFISTHIFHFHALVAVAIVAFFVGVPETLFGMDHVSLKRNGTTKRVSGKVVVEVQNGGLLFCARDGVLWEIQPEEIAERDHDDDPFDPLSAAQVAENLLASLPAGFRVHHTAHYVICYNTSPAYAQWCGALYERLFRGFYTYWSHLGVDLVKPETPLVALVFASKDSYTEYKRRDLGEDAGAMIGYYNMKTNRVNMYDLTGIEGLKRPRGRISSADRINQILQQPRAAPTVATIVHEATHQLAYNSGLQVRYADNPLWVSEGIAVYFEAPDLKSSKGWRGIGSVNRERLLRFRKYLRKRPADSLITLLSDHKRLKDPSLERRFDAYAEAWALNYYLFKSRKEDYVRYLKALAKKQPIFDDDPKTRIAEFKAVFGSDLEMFDEDFVRYIRQRR